jgi:transcriptional regulator with XRE-family HTH domain
MNKIAKARKDSGATQAALAERLGVTIMAVAHWENGRRSPSIKTLKAIADALGVDARDLL